MGTIRYDLFIKRYMTNILQKGLEAHIRKHSHRRVHKFLHHINTIHHTLLHAGELIVIATLGWSSLLFANYNVGYESFHRTSMTEVSKYLLSAEKMGKPDQNNLISTRNIDQSVNNTFTPGYCTYGAARISPEFFPYSGDTQVRTRWGNAVDRCENAAAAGFDIGANAKVGALVVYNPGNGISALGHVGKVMFYNSKTNNMIVRDMNRIIKGVMADHRDNMSTASVKCFIYPKAGVSNTNNEVNTTPEVETGTTTSWTVTTPVSSPIIVTPTTSNTGTTNNTTTPTETNTTKPKENHNSASNSQTSNQEPEQTTPVISNPVISKEINMNLDDISDIAKEFMNQYDFTIQKTSREYVKVGDTISIKISAKEKTTNTSYKGILPFILNILTSNSKLTTNISRIQLLQWDEIEISVRAKEAGSSNIIVTIDDQTIANIEVNAIN